MATSPGMALTPSSGKVSGLRAQQAHVAPLEPEGLLGTFGPFCGACCHGFILLVTLDIDIRMNLLSWHQPRRGPGRWMRSRLPGEGSWPGGRHLKRCFSSWGRRGPLANSLFLCRVAVGGCLAESCVLKRRPHVIVGGALVSPASFVQESTVELTPCLGGAPHQIEVPLKLLSWKKKKKKGSGKTNLYE